VSPPLQWTDAPAGTKSFALICEDPDAPSGTWVHWVLYNLPPTTCELHQHLPTSELLSEGAKQGRTDFHRIGYGGPCPPPGKPHRYFFKLAALDSLLQLDSPVTRATLLDAMQGHILAEASLMGMYQRNR
jgi:Raf kinase inhibitor-like YbhB/YbcL family protein